VLADVIPEAVDALHAALAPLSEADRNRLKALAQRVAAADRRVSSSRS
jgi:hypothetical protein